jgi:DNA helicase IV
MYGTLNFIMALVNGAAGTSPRESEAITVLADDNQRLVEGRNSTVEQIRQALLLHESEKNVFRLKKNYRNTKEIARFAARFYVGNSSGIPLLPEKKGTLPTVYTVGRDTDGKNLNAMADKIATYAKLRNEEIGVLVPDNKVRTSMRNRLRAKLGDRVKVQSYGSDDKTDRIEDLVFDDAGCITVLNYYSAKGLEFDAVFVVDPGRMVTASLPPLHLKMTLYVMCSRARTTLGLMLVKDNSLEGLLEWIGPTKGLCKLEEL